MEYLRIPLTMIMVLVTICNFMTPTLWGKDVIESSAALPNKMCPVMPDEKVDPNISVEYKGETIYLCCNMCKRMFLEEPEKYIAQLPQFQIEQISYTSAEDSTHEKPREDTSPPDTSTTNQGDHPTAVHRTIKFGGKFHPIIVHFPIALAFVALLAELLFIFTKKEQLRFTGRFTVFLAAIASLIAAPLGWAAAVGANYPSLEQTLEWHRWIGISATILLMGCTILSELSARKKNSKLYITYVMVLLIAAIGIGIAGHLGATLIYGPDHFTF